MTLQNGQEGRIECWPNDVSPVLGFNSDNNAVTYSPPHPFHLDPCAKQQIAHEAGALIAAA